jgi:hypothetical protein
MVPGSPGVGFPPPAPFPPTGRATDGLALPLAHRRPAHLAPVRRLRGVYYGRLRVRAHGFCGDFVSARIVGHGWRPYGRRCSRQDRAVTLSANAWWGAAVVVAARTLELGRHAAGKVARGVDQVASGATQRPISSLMCWSWVVAEYITCSTSSS